jgi:hypothetical protein
LSLAELEAAGYKTCGHCFKWVEKTKKLRI